MSFKEKKNLRNLMFISINLKIRVVMHSAVANELDYWAITWIPHISCFIINLINDHKV